MNEHCFPLNSIIGLICGTSTITISQGFARIRQHGAMARRALVSPAFDPTLSELGNLLRMRFQQL